MSNKGLHMVTFALLVIGGLNWLLFGLFGVDITVWLGGGMVGTVIYVLIGLSAIYEIFIHKGKCRLCNPQGMNGMAK